MSNIYRFKAFENLPHDFLQKLSSNYIIKNVKFTFKNEITNPEKIIIYLCSEYDDYIINLYYNSLEHYNNTYNFNVFPITDKIIFFDIDSNKHFYVNEDVLDTDNCYLEIELIYQNELLYLTYSNKYNLYLKKNTNYIISNYFISYNDLINYLSFYLNTSTKEIKIWINEKLKRYVCLTFYKDNDEDGKILLERKIE
jgi:hypothetical protein